MADKACTVCGEVKALSEFYKSKAGAQGVLARCKPCWEDANRDTKLKRMYGIGSDDYDEMYVSQGGRCKICGTHQSDLKKALHVDHCHDTGKVRGLLCQRCNTYIAHFERDPERLLVAYDYLRGE